MSRWTQVRSHHHAQVRGNFRRRTAQNCIGIPATIVFTIVGSPIYKPPPPQFFCVRAQIKISGWHTTWSRWCCTWLLPYLYSWDRVSTHFQKQSHCTRQKAPSKAGLWAHWRRPDGVLIFHNQWQLHWCQSLSNHWAQAQVSKEASDWVTRVWREERWSGTESTSACDMLKERNERQNAEPLMREGWTLIKFERKSQCETFGPKACPIKGASPRTWCLFIAPREAFN